MEWQFLDFVDENGANVIKEWIAKLPPHAQKPVKAKLKTRLLNFQGMPTLEGQITPLVGCPGVLEIKMFVGKVRYRPLVCYKSARQVVLLYVAKEQGGKLKPPSACGIAQERRAVVLNDAEGKRVCEHDLR